MKRFFFILVCTLLQLGPGYGQINAVEGIQGETQTPGSQKAVADVVVIPKYMLDPDGSGFSSSFTGIGTNLLGNWDFEDASYTNSFINRANASGALTSVGTTSSGTTSKVTQVEDGVSKAAQMAGTEHLTATLPSGAINDQFTMILWFKLDPGSLDVGTSSYSYQTLARIDGYHNSGSNSTVFAVGRKVVGSADNKYLVIRSGVLSASKLKFLNLYQPDYFLNHTNGTFSIPFPISNNIDDGKWHRLVVCYDRSKLGTATNGGPFAVYLDSTTRLTTPSYTYATAAGPNKGIAISASGKKVYFGYASDEGAGDTPIYRLQGVMDRIRFYGRELNSTEVGYLAGQNVDGVGKNDLEELRDFTDPLDPGNPVPTAAHDDDKGLPAIPNNLLSRWDFESFNSSGKIEDLATGHDNDLTNDGVSLDDGNGMPSISGRFEGSGKLTQNTLDWGSVGNYSISQWIRFRPEGNFSSIDWRDVLLWEINGAHSNVANTVNSIFFSVGYPGNRFSIRGYNKTTGGTTSGGKVWQGIPNIADGGWHLLTLVRDKAAASSGYFSLWVDGVSCGPPSDISTSNPYSLSQWAGANLDGSGMQLAIGASSVLPNDFAGFKGNMDKIRVWDGLLTSDSINKLYYQNTDGGTGDTMADIDEISLGYDPLTPNVFPSVDSIWKAWDAKNLPSDAAANLVAYWNFEELKYTPTPAYFENQPAVNTYKLVPNGKVFVDTKDSLGTNYASFRGNGSMEVNLGQALDSSDKQWAVGGWLRVDRDTIWQNPGAPTPLWEMTDVLSTTDPATDNYRLHAVRAGEYTQVFFGNFNPSTGLSDTSGSRWLIPRSLRLDDGGWHHVVLQCRNTTSTIFQHELYVDGKLIRAYSAGGADVRFTSTALKLRMGMMKYNTPSGRLGDYGLRGAWDRLRVYNTALTSGLIKSFYEQDMDDDDAWDIQEYGVVGRSAIDANDEDAPEGDLKTVGTDLTRVDLDGLPSFLRAGNLLGIWDFEEYVTGSATGPSGFVDKASAGATSTQRTMRPMGTPTQVGAEPGIGMPSKSAFVKDGGYLSVPAGYMAGAKDLTTAVWVKTEPGLLERSPAMGVCLVSFEDLQSPADANTLSLTLSKVGASQALKVQNFGTSTGFIKPTTLGSAWSLVERRIDDGNWHHIAWVRDGNANILYVDGLRLDKAIAIPNAIQRVSTLVSLGNASSPQMLLGRASAKAPGLAINANFDRMRIYNKALAASQIEELYQQDFDGDGFSDYYELGRFGFDPLMGPGETNEEEAEVLEEEWDDDTGIPSAAATTLVNGLVGDYPFELSAGFEVGDSSSSVRFPANRPEGQGAAIADGGVQWNLEDGMLSRSVSLSEDGYVSFPAKMYEEGSTAMASSFWVRMEKDEIATRAEELGTNKKIALLTFGLDRSKFPRFIASVNAGYEIVVETFDQNSGGSTVMAKWRLPAKLDDGKWHQVILNLSGTSSEVIVDNLRSSLSSTSAGEFPPIQAFTQATRPYLWIGFRKNMLLDQNNNLVASALNFTGFTGSLDRVRFYNRKITSGARRFATGEAAGLYFQDRDGDGVPDVTEANANGNPYDSAGANTTDGDGDGIPDANEIVFASDAIIDLPANAGKTDRRHPDFDGDWMADGWELGVIIKGEVTTNFTIPSNVPLNKRFSPVLDNTSLWMDDYDEDLLGGLEESRFGSNPYLSDADGDGFDDFAERRGGGNPNKNSSVPATVGNHPEMANGPKILSSVGPFTPGAPPGGDPSYSYNGSDATGPRYRKVSLNGRPIGDEAPEAEEESDGQNEEAYVDAYSLGLHFDHSLIYVPLGSSELALKATLSLSDESWTDRSGVRPHEKLTNPFGACWTSNLCAYIEETVEIGGAPDSGATPDPEVTYTVVDEDGRQMRFGSYDGRTIFAYPGSLSDRKSYQHEMDRQSADVIVLRKKFGTILTYEKVDLDQIHLANRGSGGSGSTIKHRYYRLAKVEDRFGNSLQYEYSAGAKRTLIPSVILDPKRPGQRITISVNADDPRRIDSITDPMGHSHSFKYLDKPIPGGAASGSLTQKVLSTIIDPLSGGSTEPKMRFGYEAVTEKDISNANNVTFYHSLNLNLFTTKRSVSTSITYEADDDKFSSSVGGGEANVRRIFGLPRLVKTVRSAVSAPASLPGEWDVEQIAEFSRREGMRWIYTSGGVKMLSGGNLGTPATDWYNQVRDGEGNVTTYAFKDVKAGLVDTSTHGSNTSLNWMIYYLRMDIIHPGNAGTETYKFDLSSGLSLQESIDICDNHTYYRYGDSWGGVSIAPSTMRDLAIFGRWSDPTEKIDALGRRETYVYSPNYRIMSAVVNATGVKTAYTVDRLGRRTGKIVTERSGAKLSEEVYAYGNEEFPSFMTKKTVKSFKKVGQAVKPSWEKNLITNYVADDCGRLSKESIEMGETIEVGTDSYTHIETVYAYDNNGNKTSERDPEGRTTYFVHDPLNRLSRTIFPDENGALVEKAILYDRDGNKHAEYDENGNCTIWLYDALGRMRTMIRDMDNVGVAEKVEEPAGYLDDVTPSGQGFYYRLGKAGYSTLPDLVTQKGYNDVDTLISVTDPNGVSSLTSVDALQRVVTLWEGWQEAVDRPNDGADFATSTTKRVTTYAYDVQANCGGSIFAGDGFRPTSVSRLKAVMMDGGLTTITTKSVYDKVYRPLYERVQYGVSFIDAPPAENGQTVYDSVPGSTTTTKYEYNDLALTQDVTTAFKGANSSTTRKQLDGLGRVIAEIVDYGGVNATTITDFSSTGFAYRTVDAEGRETQTDYDAAGRPTDVWKARSDLAVGESGFGLVDRTTQLSSQTVGSPHTTTSYDRNGNVIETKSARFATTKYTYDWRNRKRKETLPSVNVVETYAQVTSPVTTQSVRETVYDAGGRVTAEKDAGGSWTRKFYDRADRVIFSRVNPGNGLPSENANANGGGAADITTEQSYDRNGNILWTKDGNGNYTRNKYDVFNRLVVTATDPADGNPTDPNSEGYAAATYQSGTGTDIVVVNTYDDGGNLTSVTDGKGQYTAFRYDGLARKTKVYWDYGKPLQQVESLIYNGVLLVQKANPDGSTIDLAYDSMRRLETVSYSSRSQDNRKMTYDKVGNLTEVNYTQAVDDIRNVSQKFDALNRVREETSNGRTHLYIYDKSGNRRKSTYGGTNRVINSYDGDYDALERLVALHEQDSPGSPTIRDTKYYYNRNGSITFKKLPSGVWTQTTYDKLERKLSITDKIMETGKVISSFDYTGGYDKMGNVTKIIENYDFTQTAVNGRTVTNTYDACSRLKSENSAETGDGAQSKYTAYGYDKANNRTLKETTIAGNPNVERITYTYGNGTAGDRNSNQLKSYGPENEHTHFYEYDANGNRKKHIFGPGEDDFDKYTYDVENRLILLEYKSGNSTSNGNYGYVYDHRSRRVSKSEPGGGSSIVVTNISFSGGTSVQEWIDNVISREYVRGSDYGGGIGGILYSMGANTTNLTFNQYNSRGDVIGQTALSGLVSWQGSYEAFGARQRQGGTPVAPQRANTKDEDPTGLLNEGMRYRDIATGVFITRDPVGFIDGPNVYTYVKQNPWTSFDPDGLFSWKAFGKGVLIGAAVAVVVVAVVVAAPAVLASAAIAAGATAATAATVATTTSAVIVGASAGAAVYSAPSVGGELASIATGDDIRGSWSQGFENKGQLSDDDRSFKAGNLVGGLLGGAAGVRSGQFIGNSAKVVASRTVAARRTAASGKPFVPDEYWSKNAPTNVTPGTRRLDHTKFNTKTKQYEQSRVIYDEYGRQKFRVDKTDHGRPKGNEDINDTGHSNPHLHESTYHPRGTRGAQQGSEWKNGTKGDPKDTGLIEKKTNFFDDEQKN